MLQTIQSLDAGILLWIQQYIRNDFLTPIMCFITELGNSGIIWILITLIMLIIKKTRKVGIMSALSLIIIFIVGNVILKNAVGRIRPYEVVDGLVLLIEKQKDLSFPSGHAASAFAVAAVMFKALPKKIGVPALVFAIIISLSRLYVGVHYPTDVIGGVLLGTASAIFVLKFIGPKLESKKVLEKENEAK